MLMKLLVNVFERARSKLTLTNINNRFPSDSDLENNDIDHKSFKFKCSSFRTSITQHQPRSSLSKWLCTTPITTNKSISNRVRRSNSWRSLRERGNNSSINSRTYSVDELNRNHSQFNRLRRQDVSHSPLKHFSQIRRKHSNDFPSHKRFDRISTNLIIDYSNSKKKIFSTLSHHSNGGDSGYSDESFLTRTCQRPLHTSCPHCHCEQRSSFNSYKKLSKTISSSSDSSPSNLYYSHRRPSQPVRITRTIQEKRRRNLSCDGSLWTQTQHSKTMKNSTKTLPFNSHVFGELNIAAIELDSLQTSFSSSLYSSSSSSSSLSSSPIHQENHFKKQRRFLVSHEYENNSLLSKTNGTKIFAVQRGDQVRILKRMGKSTLLVQKDDDGSIGFLPQTYLVHYPINSFLSLKGLRETVL